MSKEKLIEKYQYKIKMRNKYVERINKEISALRKELAKDCDHPSDFVVDYKWEWDDGYGKQKWVVWKRCTLCQKVNRWNGSYWSSN